MTQQIRSRYKRFVKLCKFSSSAIRNFGFRFFIIAAFSELKKYKLEVFAPEPEIVNLPPISRESIYLSWLQEHQITEEVELTIKKELQNYSYKPKLTVVLSISEKNTHYNEVIISIINQIYQDWNLYLHCPSAISKTIDVSLSKLSNYNTVKSKIQQIDSKTFLDMPGDFIVFLNCGTILIKNALFKIIQFLNEVPDAEIIYSDEDQLTDSGNRINPFFKPDWSPYLFLSRDYVSNFFVVKNKLLKELEFKNHDYFDYYDLLLRLTENTKKIFHIPMILASVRTNNNFELENNFDQNAETAISKALRRRHINGKATKGVIPKTYRVMYSLEKEPKVSIIIPTKDNKELLKRCITNIKKKTAYKNYEIIIIDNNSTKEEALSYLRTLPYTIIKYDSQFNFSKMNNLAASQSSSEYLLFLNDDAAPLQSTWLSEMISICQLNDVGIVGAKLVHGNNTIQHAGIALLKTGAGFHPMQGVDADKAGYFGFLNVIRDCSAVTGACLLIKKENFDKMGGFDDKFDLYYGDVDLCLNVIKHGYRVVYTPYALLLHQGSSKIKEYSTAFFAVENYCYFIKKWPTLKYGDPFYNSNLGWDYRIDVGDNLIIEGEFNINKEELKNILIRKYTEFLDSTYRELLLRPADNSGLLTHLPKLMDKQISEDDVRRMILQSEEAQNIQKFSHYSDKYWNELDLVNSYLNKLSTGDEKINWMGDIKSRFKEHLPFRKVLIVGCGNGWLERRLYDLGIGEEFDAFDISGHYLETARQAKGGRSINYFVSDINNMKNIENVKYDAVFNFAILHHATKIEYAMKKLSKVLKPGGLMFNWEYVGPSQNQYNDEHVKIMEGIMSRLPARLRNKYPLRPPLENFRVEPTEAIHSDLVRSMFKKYFDTVYERDLNGGVAYQIFWNNIDEFKKDDEEAKQTLEFLINKDEEYTRSGKVPVLFWYSVGRPKPAHDIKSLETSRR